MRAGSRGQFRGTVPGDLRKQRKTWKVVSIGGNSNDSRPCPEYSDRTGWFVPACRLDVYIYGV